VKHEVAMGHGTRDTGHGRSKLLPTSKGQERLTVCKVQSDFRLKAQANVATNKGNPIGIDCDERALLPVENAKDTQSCNSLRTVICYQAEMKRPHENRKTCPKCES
jgi:hypothetical protein